MLQQVSQLNQVTVLEDATFTHTPDPNSINHLVSLERGTATAGTVALTAKADNASTAEAVNDEFGAAITWDLTVAGAITYKLENLPVAALILTQTGSNGTIKVACKSW